MVNRIAEDAPTSEKLLAAAEGLFLERGYGGVSIRDITEQAGVNVASINYYFKSKKNLYRKVVSRLLKRHAVPRVEELERLIEGKAAPDEREVIRAYVSGFFRDVVESKEAHMCLNMVLSEMTEGGIATDIVIKDMVAPVHKVLKEAIVRSRPGLSETKVSLCISSIGGQVIHFIRARELIKRMTGRGYTRKFIDDIVEHITEFSLKGIG